MKTDPAGHRSNTFLWLVAMLLVFLVTGCGGGGTGSDLFIPSLNSAPGAPGTLIPGTVVSSTTPSVPSSNPSNGASTVPVSTVQSNNTLLPRIISATFSEAMDPATLISPALTFTLKETVSGLAVAGLVSMNSPTNTVATFTPTAPLAPNTQFTAIITTAARTAAGAALGSGYGWSFTTGSQVGQAPINLGTAANFLVLGGTSIANTSTALNPTRVNGALGINPGGVADVTGFTDSTVAGTGLISTGGIQVGALVTQARTDLLAALAEATARSSQQVVVGNTELSAFTVNSGSPGVYPPGLYTSVNTLTLSAGNMTLDARGDPDAVWVFKAGSSLSVAATRQMLLLNGARASNVFWSLGSSATIGDQARFKGNILAGSSSTVGTSSTGGATVEGRLLSTSGLVLNYATINAPAP